MAVRFAILFLALLLDRFVGDPEWLWSRVRHPIVWFGKAVGITDSVLNRPADAAGAQRAKGVAATVILLLAAIAAGLLIDVVLSSLSLLGIVIEVVVASIFLAQKSLADHVSAVADDMSSKGLAGGRAAVAKVVGRDPETLDAAGICRAAIESLSENFSDGVVAPAFWYGLFGLPGLLAYKMLNTADSMIGHKNERYLNFGWASARLDDLANYVPARLSILFISLGAWVNEGFAAARRAFRVARSDHGFHRSPNSGWPEAAMAGALDLQLAGPRIYGGELVMEPMLNPSGGKSSGQDIRRAIDVFYSACMWMMGFAGFLCLVGAPFAAEHM